MRKIKEKNEMVNEERMKIEKDGMRREWKKEER